MPSKSVVTIAMTDGACAEEVAREAARRLGFRYVNDEILDRAAELAGADAKAVAEVEHTQPLVARILRTLATMPLDMGGYISAETIVDETPGYRALIQDVVRSVAAEGQVVIGAHAGSMNLAGMPGLLRVFVTAPFETRVARVAEERGWNAAAARKEVEHTDRERRAYFQRFFQVDHELPTHYDLVVNTEVLSAEQAAGLIAAAAS